MCPRRWPLLNLLEDQIKWGLITEFLIVKTYQLIIAHKIAELVKIEKYSV